MPDISSVPFTSTNSNFSSIQHAPLIPLPPELANPRLAPAPNPRNAAGLDFLFENQSLPGMVKSAPVPPSRLHAQTGI